MKPTAPCLLTINGGSSSIKFALYQVGEPLQRGLNGTVDRIGSLAADQFYAVLEGHGIVPADQIRPQLKKPAVTAAH